MTLFENLFESLKSLLGGNKDDAMSMEEKRTSYRLPCHINVQCKAEGAAFHALSTDIGSTGMRLEASEREKVKKSSKLVITIADKKTGSLGPPIPAEVMWRRRIGETGRVYLGVHFACRPENLKSTWVGPYLEKLGYHEKAKAAERRRFIRLGSGLPVEITATKDGSRIGSGRLIDLSGGGAKAQLNGHCASGIEVVLKIGPLESLAAIEVPGSVVICREDREKEDLFVIRTRFASLEPTVHKALKKYLSTLQKRNSTL